MRALITGGKGFVGHWLAAHLKDRGDEVVVIDIETDVADGAAVGRVMADVVPEAVYHLAAMTHVGESWEHPGQVLRVNVLGTAEILAAARHPERIVRTGYLPDEAVPALLRQAAVVAYPALEEGFGLPALEALACGAPLVTTEGTAMAEMAGDAALLVPPGDVSALAAAIGTALQDGRATARRSLGLTVASERTWEASVALHLRAYAVARAASQ